MTAQSSPEWGTITDAADRLAVSTKTIRRMIARGDLPARRIGRRLIRVDLRALDDLGRPLAVPAR